MGALFEYMEQTQRFLRDSKQEFLDPGNLLSYINRARREIAMRAQCVRVLTPISGQIIGWDVDNTHSNGLYSLNPTLAITPPDYPSGALPKPNGDQAIALAIVQDGTIASIDSQYGGQGYFQPIMTITDPTGKGAVATPRMSFINQLNQGQEQYTFSNVDLSMFPGVGSIYMIKSVSLLFSNYRYSLACYDFSTYQALIRQFQANYQYVPAVCAQYGQGTNGSFFMYPLPNAQYQLELDCFCLPQDMLLDDQNVECIPGPWTDAVAYMSAALCYEELQNWNAAKYYHEQFDKRAQRYSDYARPGRRTNPYGRY